MRAAIYTRYGPPEVVTVGEIPAPIPKDNEILVRVHASTVNRTDTGFRSAHYFITRFWSGLFSPNRPVLGCEFAGVVEGTGKNVSHFRKGDRVFGYNDETFGGHAEFMTIAEHKAVTTIPANFDFYQAAALTEGSHYALNGIRAAKVRRGQNVLVYGATGAIGSAAVQLLKHFGAFVTAVCNTKNVELVRGLGADHVIDYETQDFTKRELHYDFILDAVGKSSFGQCKPLLTEKGIYISTELGKNAENIGLAITTPLFGGKKVLFPIPTISKADVNFLKELAERGEFTPAIDRKYKLEEIVEAHRYAESGKKTGNVVISVSQSIHQ